MGVSIYATNSEYEFDGGYGGFMCLRENIAKAFDKEFGEHYDNLSKCWRKEQFDEWDKKASEILAADRFKDEDQDIIDFLFMPDSDGEISHKTCKKIYDLIKDIDFKGQTICYGYKNDGKDYERFKEFLLDCYKRHAKMRWA